LKERLPGPGAAGGVAPLVVGANGKNIGDAVAVEVAKAQVGRVDPGASQVLPGLAGSGGEAPAMQAVFRGGAKDIGLAVAVKINELVAISMVGQGAVFQAQVGKGGVGVTDRRCSSVGRGRIEPDQAQSGQALK
jgi:hypothetical protein